MAKAAMFIDGSNFFETMKRLGLFIDYAKIQPQFLDAGDEFVRGYYFTAIKTEEDGTIKIKELLDWLEFNGWTIISKPTKQMRNDEGRIVTKGNMDIEIAVKAMQMASKIDKAYLFTGDGDFVPLVKALQDQGVRVIVVSSMKTRKPMVAEELRRQADKFLDLDDYRDKLSRNQGAQHGSDPLVQPERGAVHRSPILSRIRPVSSGD